MPQVSWAEVPERKQDMKNAPAVNEIIVKANEESLNNAINDNHIAPESIIPVIFQPANHLAIGDYEAKYRVIYRA
jgi:hypothetical protein